MKISAREKILVRILAFVVCIGLYYQFLIVPQFATLEQLNKELTELKQFKAEITFYGDPEGHFNIKYLEFIEDMARATEAYFPELIQERIVLLVDEMLTSSGLAGINLAFSTIQVDKVMEKKALSPLTEKPFKLLELKEQAWQGAKKPTPVTPTVFSGTGEAYKMELNMDFQGSYEQLMAFLHKVENGQYKIVLTSLVFNNSGSELKGTMIMHFYGIPKPVNQDLDYLTLAN